MGVAVISKYFSSISVLTRNLYKRAVTTKMVLRIIAFFFLLACPTLIQAQLPICPVCPLGRYALGTAVKVAKKIVSNNDKSSCGCSLPSLLSRETYDDYIQRVFLKKEDEPLDTYFARIYKQYKDESDEKYIHRIEKIYSIFPQLPCKDNLENWNFSERYYRLKYGRLDSIIPFFKESNDQYYARILRREKDEEFGSFIKRLDCIYKAYPKLDIWRRIKFDSDCRNWYFYRHLAYNSAIRPSENIRESIVKKYERRACEEKDNFSYFKRIVARLPGESDIDYVDRLNRIRSRFGNLPLWYNPEYLDLVKNYYQLLFSKKDNECLNDYYKRLTTKSAAEDFDTYVKRINILQKVFNQLPLWDREDYLQFTAPYFNWIYGKKPDESNESYLKRVTIRSPSESLNCYLNRLNIIRWVNRGTDLFYNRSYWPYIKTYYENFYKRGSEETEKWLARLFKRGYEETDDEYVKRLSLVTSVQESLSKIDIPETCLKYVSDFYRLGYKRLPSEDQDSWLKRVTTRLATETDVTFQTRLKYLENVYTDCRSFVGGVLRRLFGPGGRSCSKKGGKEVEVLVVKKKEKETAKKVEKTKKQTVEKEENKSDVNPSKWDLSEEDIEKLYGKKKDEDDTTWFKRLTLKTSSSESPEQYVKTLNLVRKYFPSLPLWYSKKNIDFIKEYYTFLYKKEADETDEHYFDRIVSKEAWESWEQTAKRVSIVRDIYPKLALWNDAKYYDKFTKKLIEVEYRKRSTESEEEYVQRILAKDSIVDTSTELWAKRIRLIQQATSSCSIWYDEKYFSFTKSFYEVYYKKNEDEECDAWLTRVLKPLTGESEESAIQRVRLVKQTTGDCGCWTEFTFKKVHSSKYLSEDYLEDVEKEFFDSSSTYEKIYSSSKSSRSEASTEEQKEVVRKS